MNAKDRAKWEQIFPELSPLEIAQVMASATAPKVATTSTAQVSSQGAMTIGEILVQVRAEYMEAELERPRAKTQPDGTMKLKDTSTYRTYETNWIRLDEQLGDLPVAKLTKQVVKSFCSKSMKIALATHKRNNDRREARGLPTKEETGHQAYNRALDTVATVVRFALDNGLIVKSPLIGIKRKPLSESDRHGLSQMQVEEIMHTALNGGNDPVLDYVLIWTLLETACRVGGLLKLTVGDINVEEQTVRVHEKGDKSRRQPVTRELAEMLLALAKDRGAKKKSDPIFHFLVDGPGAGRPMSSKRFETLWSRIAKELPWVAEKRVTSHWLRHTTLSWLDRIGASETVVSKYAGHGPSTVTGHYTKVRLEEISRAHEKLFGRAHPLAMR